MSTAIVVLMIVQWSVCAFFVLYAVYYVVTALFYFKRRKRLPEPTQNHKFAVLIPARNEEAVIANLVQSIQRQRYPAGLLDVYVIPNNCTDNTKQAAEQAGAFTIEPDCPIKSKGEALSFAIDYLLKKGDYDAFCVFDADNLVHPDFFVEMNRALCAGAQVAQGSRDSKNPYDTAVSTSYSIYYWMVDLFYNRARSAINLSAIISGSGFVFTTDLMRRWGGWHTVTLAEDIEFSLQCALQEEKIVCVPEAVVFDEQPVRFGDSIRQRHRWVSGLFQGLYGYGKKLCSGVFIRHSALCLDMLLFFIISIMQISFVVGYLFAIVINILMNINRGAFDLSYLGFTTLVSFGSPYICFGFVAFLCILFQKKNIKKAWKGIFFYPLFIMSYLLITIRCTFRLDTEWQVVRHTKNISIDDLAKLQDRSE